MKKRKASAFINLLLCFCSVPVFSQSKDKSKSIQGYVQADDVKKSVFTGDEADTCVLAPENPLAQKISVSWNNEESPIFLEEKLFRMNKSDWRFEASDKTGFEEKVTQILCSISKMKGMQYYSNGDKKWETLYHQAYFVASPKNLKPLEDINPTDQQEMESQTYYCFLNDNSFGKIVYGINYEKKDNEQSVVFTNVNDLKYGPVKAVSKEGLKISVDVIDEGEQFYVYIILQASYTPMPLLQNRLQRSFDSRIDAIYSWFMLQLNDQN